LREAAKLGFKRAIVPRSQIPPDLELETIQVTKVLDAILEAIPGSPNMPNVPPQPTASNNRPTLPVVEGELEDEDDDDDWEAETDLF
jgi:DNA repair protein RadA/Sms